MTGTIVELGERDFGWIESESGRVFFGAAGLGPGLSMPDVRLGQRVAFVVHIDRHGRREARSVAPA